MKSVHSVDAHRRLVITVLDRKLRHAIPSSSDLRRMLSRSAQKLFAEAFSRTRVVSQALGRLNGSNGQQSSKALSTSASPLHEAATESHLVMNKLGFEQKTIVQQTLPATSYCRCWLSKSFPKCDGSHKHHNAITGTKIHYNIHLFHHFPCCDFEVLTLKLEI